MWPIALATADLHIFTHSSCFVFVLFEFILFHLYLYFVFVIVFVIIFVIIFVIVLVIIFVNVFVIVFVHIWPISPKASAAADLHILLAAVVLYLYHLNFHYLYLNF